LLDLRGPTSKRREGRKDGRGEKTGGDLLLRRGGQERVGSCFLALTGTDAPAKCVIPHRGQAFYIEFHIVEPSTTTLLAYPLVRNLVLEALKE